MALVLATDDGGLGGERWYPAALFELALLALTLTVARGRATFGRGVGVALGALVALALWALASAAWSDVPALARDGGNRVLLYAIVLAIVAARPWPRRAFTLALALVSGGLGAIAVGILVQTALIADPSRLFVESRLSAPTSYANATASLWLIGVWPAIALACAARARAELRVVAIGVACLLLEVSLLSVSRGALAAAVAAALVFVAAGRERRTLLGALAVVVGCCVLAAGPLLAVSEVTTGAELAGALGAARGAIAWTTLLAMALAGVAILLAPEAARRGVAWRSAADRRLGAVVSGGAARMLRGSPRRNLRAAAIALALAASLAAVATGQPASWAQTRWGDFTSSGYSKVGTGSARITGSLGSSRYDFYRVAVGAFAQRPIAGVGYGNFEVPYLADRRTDEAPRYAHSLVFGVLSQVGLVGAALMLAFLAAIGGAIRRALARAGERRTLVAGALGGVACWFAHGLVDWVWEFPALGMLSFALLGLAARGCAEDAGPAHERGPEAARLPRMRPLVAVALGVATLAAAGSFVTLGVAAHLTREALDEAPRDPQRAMAHLRQAARFDPLAASPLLSRGVLAVRVGDRAAAERSFEAALKREPRNWFAELELGALYAGSGRQALGLQALARAERLNPREQVIDEARATIRAGAGVDPRTLERARYEVARSRLARMPGR